MSVVQESTTARGRALLWRYTGVGLAMPALTANAVQRIGIQHGVKQVPCLVVGQHGRLQGQQSLSESGFVGPSCAAARQPDHHAEGYMQESLLTCRPHVILLHHWRRSEGRSLRE